MVNGASFPKFVKVGLGVKVGRGGERSKVACYKFEGAALHAVALYLLGNFLNTKSVRITMLATKAYTYLFPVCAERRLQVFRFC